MGHRPRRGRPGARIRSGTAQLWDLLAATGASLFATLVGLAALTSGRAAFAAVAVRRSISFAFPGPLGGVRRFTQVGPFPGPPVVFSNGSLHLSGLILLVLGLVGLGVSLYLWLRWRPLSADRRRDRSDDGVSLPSYL